MNKKRLFVLFSSYLAITLVALFLTTLFTTRAVRTFHLQNTTEDLQARAVLIKDQITPLFTDKRWPELQLLCQDLGKKSATRITVIASSGQVTADSQEDPHQLDNHGSRPEIIAAQEGRIGTFSRFSTTLQQNLRYVAIPLHHQDHIVASLRLAVPLASLDAAFAGIRLTLSLGSIAVALLIAFVTWYISQQISRPVLAMCDGAQRFAQRDFDTPIPVRGPDELMELSRGLNSMAQDLRHHIATVVNQRNELETIFASMIEGVFTVDADERFTSINQAAADLLETSRDKALGRTVLETMRNSDLKIFMDQTLRSDIATRNELTLLHHNDQTVIVSAHGVQLPETTRPSKAMVVLHDITRLKKLENIRRDFVSNVSHELKTPITSIQGFVETLLDGAIDDQEHNKRFLAIIHTQSLRLNAIIQDLLTLSRLEERQQALKLTRVALLPLLQNAINSCRLEAETKEITLTVTESAPITALVNKPLFELALTNLIGNAIKYSPSRTEVTILIHQKNSSALITVTDHGEGISLSHQGRIFERFYRVDKGRSRQAGGTGLGLAIVKHIMRCHHGEVRLTSTLGQGSTFTLILPLQNAAS